MLELLVFFFIALLLACYCRVFRFLILEETWFRV